MLVTGATGFVGANVARRLVAARWPAEELRLLRRRLDPEDGARARIYISTGWGLGKLFQATLAWSRWVVWPTPG